LSKFNYDSGHIIINACSDENIVGASSKSWRANRLCLYRGIKIYSCGTVESTSSGDSKVTVSIKSNKLTGNWLNSSL
jgi:hypothetical protein